MVTSRMLASRIVGLKTFMERVGVLWAAEDELDRELSPRPGWARWCILAVQKVCRPVVILISTLRMRKLARVAKGRTQLRHPSSLNRSGRAQADLPRTTDTIAASVSSDKARTGPQDRPSRRR